MIRNLNHFRGSQEVEHIEDRELFGIRYEQLKQSLKERKQKLEDLGLPSSSQNIYRTFCYFIESGFQEGFSPEDYLRAITYNKRNEHLSALTDETEKERANNFFDNFFSYVSQELARRVIVSGIELNQQDIEKICETFKGQHGEYSELIYRLKEEIKANIGGIEKLFKDQENIFLDYFIKLTNAGLIEQSKINKVNAYALEFRKFILSKRYNLESERKGAFLESEILDILSELDDKTYLTSFISVSPDEISEDKREEFLGEIEEILKRSDNLVNIASSSIGIPVTPIPISEPERRVIFTSRGGRSNQFSSLSYDFGVLEDMQITPSTEFLTKAAESLESLISEMEKIDDKNVDRVIERLEKGLDQILTFIEREFTPPTPKEISEWFTLENKKRSNKTLSQEERERLERLSSILRRNLSEGELNDMYSEIEKAGFLNRGKKINEWRKKIERKIANKNPNELKKAVEVVENLRKRIKEARSETNKEEKIKKVKEILNEVKDFFKLVGTLILTGGFLWFAVLGFYFPIWLIEKMRKEVEGAIK